MRNKIIGISMCILLITTTIPAVTCREYNESSTIPTNSIHDGSYMMWNSGETQRITPKIQEIIDKINETLIRNFIEYLVVEIGNRYTGTDGCKKAATYIYQQFENMGLQSTYQNWSSWGNSLLAGFFTSQNVIGTHQGTDPDEIIIFNAHYDTAKRTVGAVDDGSGTAGVLAAAYVLCQYQFKRTMEFVAFSGEEQGTLGSYAYARKLYDQHTPVLVEFNADMIGKATSKETGKTIRLSITEDAGWIAGIMETMTKEYGLNFNITRWQMIDRDARSGWSDYFKFTQLGYESVVVWPGEWDPNMHTTRDNLSNVNISYLVNMTRHIAATMAILADMEITQPQLSIAHPRFGTIVMNDNEKLTYKYKTPIILDDTTIQVEVTQGSNPIEKVEFYYDNSLLLTDTEKPYEYLLNNTSFGIHKIKVIAYDTIGANATDEMKILFINIPGNRL
ncbi:MAG TPA: M28 family peptidase [Candidatus Thermoplasmatota archaeon]|nr:M28 family peptidase [Candidatus Thermoplasmatota archaeon]